MTAESYSPARRTALVLTGTGADGAYHAGVVRALHETGIKIDVVCGRGIGAVGAIFTAVDGGSRLSDGKGVWRRSGVERLYTWRWPIRVIFAVAAGVAGVLLSPLFFLALGLVAYLLGLFLGMAGLDLGAAVLRSYAEILAAAFSPAALPTWLPRLIAVGVIVTLIILTVGTLWDAQRRPRRRHARNHHAWALIGTPLDGTRATRYFVEALWDLLKGGASLKVPAGADLSRRFTELLNDNLGQPEFSELLLTVHDRDGRRDRAP